MEPGGVEAVADAMTGGLIGRALEPGAGEAREDGQGACLNCGTTLLGPHCHACGQPAHVHRSLRAFWHDLAHGVLHFEGKIWRTLPLLAWRPGELTRRYVEGQRARFVSPIALFLFCVFLMFAVIHVVGAPDFSQTPQQKAEQRVRAASKLKEAEAQRAAALAAGRDTHNLDARIAALQLAARPAAPAADGKPAPGGDAGIGDMNVGSKLGWVNDGIKKAKANPELLLYKLQTNGYKFSWLLIPISVPFVWLLFLHRRRYWRFGAYDHIVFVTYSLCFMTLMVVAFSLLGKAIGSNDVAAIGIMIVPPFHIYRQLRGAYGVSRFGGIWRAIALSFFGCICLMLFFLLLLALGMLN